MDDLSNIFEEADRYLYKALYRWKNQYPTMWEDAMQEGMIQVWRDIDAGETIKLKILRRASMSANKYIHRNGEYSFGKPKKSRDGLKSNRATFEKVQAYLDEVMPLRGNVWPTAKEVSDNTGLGYGNTQRIMKDIREGRVDHMHYREDGRMDWDFYKVSSVEDLHTGTEGVGSRGNRHWSDSNKLARYAETFEEEVLSSLSFEHILGQLTEHHQEVLRLHFVEGYTAGDLRDHFDLKTSSRATRHIEAAVSQARMVVAPYSGECAGHHLRTPENTVVKTRQDGIWTRICRLCQGARSAHGKAGAARQGVNGGKIGRPSTADCPNGHGPKTYQDSRGTMRCHTCKNEQALKSLRKKKDAGS
jgi:DNA-directed RNA polymerase specialized sigma24 family protein